MSQKLINRLERTTTYLDPAVPGARIMPVNPDGYEAAQYIYKLQSTIGWLMHDAFKHVRDEAALREMATRARNAMEGV